MTATAVGACAASSNCNSPATTPEPGLSSLQFANSSGVQPLQLWPVACRCASTLANGVLMAPTGAGKLVIEPTIANYMYICMVHNYSFIIYSAQRVINYILHNSYACATPPMQLHATTCIPAHMHTTHDMPHRRDFCTTDKTRRPTKRGDYAATAVEEAPRLRANVFRDCVRMRDATADVKVVARREFTSLMGIISCGRTVPRDCG